MFCSFYGFFLLNLWVLTGLANAVPAPTGLDKIEIRCTSFTMVWDEADNTNYKIEVKDAPHDAHYRVPPTSPPATDYVSTPYYTNSTTAGNSVQPDLGYDIYLFAINPSNPSDYNKASYLKLATMPPAPSNVQVSDIKTNQFVVSWTHSNPSEYNCGCHLAVAYQVTYTSNIGTSFMKQTPGLQQTLIVDDVTTNTDYVITVVSWKNDVIFSDNSSVATTATIPSKTTAPTNSSSATTTSISLQWDPVPGRSTSLTYTVAWLPADSAESKTGITDTTTTIYELTPSTEYVFTVTAVNDGGTGVTSDSATYSTVPDMVPAPILSSSTNLSTMIDVSWNKPAGGDDVTDYLLEWWLSNSEDVNSDTEIHLHEIDSYNYVIDGLTPGKRYGVKISARNSAGTGQSSPESSYTTAPGKSNPPTNTSSSTTTSISIAWDPVDGATSYTVAWSPHSDDGSFHKANIRDLDTTVDGLTPNTLYVITLSAVNSGGSGAPSNGATFSTVPQYVGLPSVSAPSEDSGSRSTTMTVHWSKPNGGDDVIDYVVEWWLSSENNSTSTYHVEPHLSGVEQYNSSIESLTPGERYDVRVRARNSAGTGETSSNAYHRTDPATPFHPILTQPVDDDITTRLLISWSVPEGKLDSYEVNLYVQDVPVFTHTTSYKSVLADSLIPGEMYRASVTAISEGLFGAASDKSNVQRTDPPTPMKVSLIQPSSGDITKQLEVKWGMPVTPFQVTKYIITLKPFSGMDITIQYSSDDATPISYLVDNLVPGESYSATVQAVSPSDGAPATFSETSATSFNQRTAPAPVTNLAVSQNMNKPEYQLELNWLSPAGVGNVVMIQYHGTPNAMNESANVNFFDTFLSVSVIPGNNYTFTVIVQSGEMLSEPVMETINSKPAWPKMAAESEIYELALNWDLPDGNIEGYLLEILSGNFMNIELPVNSTSYTMTKLSPETNYTIVLYSWITNISGDIEKSASIPTTYQTLPSDKPTSIMVTSTTSATISVSWSPPAPGSIRSAIVGYLVSWSPSHGCGSNMVDSTSTQITGLMPNTVYKVTISTRYEDKAGDFDETTAITCFAPPTTVTTTDSSASTIDVSWTTPDVGGGATKCDGYFVSWSPAHNAGYKEVAMNSTLYTKIAELQSNMRYNILVSAQSRAGNGMPSSPTLGITAPGSPRKVKLNKADEVYDPASTIQVEWNKPDGGDDIDNYLVEWWPSFNQSFVSFASVIHSNDDNVHKCIIIDLTGETTYKVQIKAQNSAGTGLPSVILSYKTEGNATFITKSRISRSASQFVPFEDKSQHGEILNASSEQQKHLIGFAVIGVVICAAIVIIFVGSHYRQQQKEK
ncbi:unnamed protein product [Clavelina lepadiformis]|uniref:Fibronectin type-III domain-containing protein n=2 Tax=Clavelina lepadiformis TaxID=159417 RepID=A0ABP0FY35_CLALP